MARLVGRLSADWSDRADYSKLHTIRNYDAFRHCYGRLVADKRLCLSPYSNDEMVAYIL